ncbi:hypothetical protein, partial [cf. Phormidesmis sp. LEGE 11477]|uniref:hypothetical protein n=1 Tax=cf. Phormidesmis sp. LEGE 11477 TaxID=1828680 RepID=UPI001D137824
PLALGNGLELVSNIFDAEGNRLLDYQTVTASAAPDKLFGGTDPFDENETDSYTEFTAFEDGTYYVTLGAWNNVQDFPINLDVVPSPLYDPFVPSSGNGNAWNLGNYDIEIDLLTENNPRATGIPTSAVSNPNVTNPPTLSLSANPTTVDSEGNFTNAVVEHVELDGVSSVTFTIQTEGKFPKEELNLSLTAMRIYSTTSHSGVKINFLTPLADSH